MKTHSTSLEAKYKNQQLQKLSTVWCTEDHLKQLFSVVNLAIKDISCTEII